MTETSKERLLSLVRTLLIAIGAFLIGHNYFGITIDNEWIQTTIGVAMTLVGGWWSWASKELDLEKKLSLIRNSIVFIGGIGVSAGVISGDIFEKTLGVITAILPFIASDLLRGNIAPKN